MNSEEPAYPEKTIGDILREKREYLGISQEALSSELKLKNEILASLEKSSYKDLPALPYIKAFLVTLSKKLNLNAEDLIQRLIAEMGIPREESVPVENRENLNSNTRKRNIVPLLALVFVGVALLALLLKIQQKAAPAIKPIDEKSSIPDALPGLTEIQSSAQDSLDSILSDNTADTPNDSSIGKKKIENDKKKPELNIKSQTNQVETSSNFLIFKCIKDSVWINVKRNKRKDMNKLLKKGGTWTISKSDTIIITSGIIGSIEFNLNGKSYTPKNKIFKIFNGNFQE